MISSASIAGALVGILAVAAMAAHVLIDTAFRVFGS
jgi:archaellin